MSATRPHCKINLLWWCRKIFSPNTPGYPSGTKRTCASALTRDRKPGCVWLTTRSAFGLDHTHPGTHRVRKASALLFLLGRLATRPDCSTFSLPCWFHASLLLPKAAGCKLAQNGYASAGFRQVSVTRAHFEDPHYTPEPPIADARVKFPN